MEASDRLKEIFQDNKKSHVVTLEHEFSNTQMEDFPNASAYCQRLKSLSDQLKNVRAPIDNNRLVLQLVSGLTEAYSGVATLIRKRNPLPQFYQARLMLTLEEAGLAKRTSTSSASAMVASSREPDLGAEGSGHARGRGKNHKKKISKKNSQGGGRGVGAGGGHNSGGAGGAGRGGTG
ncbi:keratin, type I cytoskeletal 9-like [Chenopodium quinoa]|uniref:keratin, type I cytoskeletal 9-like n=1 Tax=Chenopodium quinoa TaxID=63459 RepID=UPI000B79376E|nr:keratin, type I cytoskeletal 9-like [Chenopodium quinoa]